MSDTIFALSSGHPPAAIAIIRISGPAAFGAAQSIAGPLPAPRQAALRTLRNGRGLPLDRALVLCFPGPASATGEDLVELHCHGGRAVVDAVLRALEALPELRLAVGGEFTRRALEHGRIDLAQAEGLADLLEAETEEARIAALAASEGAVGQRINQWFAMIQTLRAACEAAIDYAEEGDVEAQETTDLALRSEIDALVQEIGTVLARPTVERLRDGPLIVLAGPPNAGKSSLFNALLERDAAIVTPIAGTTRDVLETAVQRGGRAYRLADTAGLAEQTNDPIEQIGIDRALAAQQRATLVLWLGEPAMCPPGGLLVHSRCDKAGRENAPPNALAASIYESCSVERVWEAIADLTREWHRSSDPVHLHDRQRRVMIGALDQLAKAASLDDPVLMAECLRVASGHIAEALGDNATEAMLDALFSRFCLGK